MIDTSIATINGNTLINGTVGGAKLTSATTLNIIDSNGTTVKTIIGAGA